jgi:hypothetical protein
MSRSSGTLTESGRFTKAYRDSFGNKIAAHFDKYCQITNPVTFCALEDIYRPAFSRKEWAALCRLLETKLGKDCLSRSTQFELYLPSKPGQSSWQRKHITFRFPDKMMRPGLDLEYADLEPAVQANLDAWLKRAVSLKELRRELWNRCDKLLDFGWQSQVHYGNNGWRGAPTPGQGCNTPGQVHRIWPEVLTFMGADVVGKVRNANMKSKLPEFFQGYGSPEQFRCESVWFHDGNMDGSDAYTDEEMRFEKRKFEALTQILVQMSLMMDVDHVKHYPSVHV